MTSDYPYGPEKPGKVERTLDVAAKILGDPFPDPNEDLEREPTPREIGREWVEHWRRFADDNGFAYRGGVSAPGFAPDERESAFLEDMRALRLPLNEVTGLCEGTWEGLPFISFDAINLGAAGSHWPYRFVCAPVQDAGLEVVHDRALRKRRPYHVEWYPRLAEYKVFSGPWNEPGKPKKAPGALGRTAFGRGLSKAVEGAADRLLMPKLHTTSLARAGTIGAQPYEQRAFRFDWAVRRRWLVVFRAEPRHRGAEPSREISALLDSFAAVNRLWHS